MAQLCVPADKFALRANLRLNTALGLNKVKATTLLCVSVLGAAATLGATASNGVALKVVGESARDKFFEETEINQIKECRGHIPSHVPLKDVGLTKEALRSGVSCVVGALIDGSKYFVLYGQEAEGYRAFLVLTVRGNTLKKTQTITGVTSFLMPFAANHSQRSLYPKVAPHVPALIRVGTGDRGWVFFFNEKTGLFEEARYEFPPSYD